MKKRGFGQGRWNGFGGKVEKGETIEAAARRELAEEAGICAKHLQKRGVLQFTFEEELAPLEVYVFSTEAFDGVPNESEEMRPQWFGHGDIPYGGMWPDDSHWLPKILAGKNITGRFHFKDIDTIAHYDVREI